MDNISAIESFNCPDIIKSKLKELTKSFDIYMQSEFGSNGWLFFGTNKITDKKVAFKFYMYDENNGFHAEPTYLETLQSDHVIDILTAELVDNKYAYFLTPCCKKGDLDREIETQVFSIERAFDATTQILLGLGVLHSERLLHRDIKPQNIFIKDNDNLAIGDFGSVKRIPDNCDYITGSQHSLIYTPPEAIKDNCYYVQSDIYQVGIIFYQLLGGTLHYNETNWLNIEELNYYQSIEDPCDRQLYAKECIKKKILSGVLNFNSLLPISTRKIDKIIRKACHIDFSKRYRTCSEFLNALYNIKNETHRWSYNNGVYSLKKKKNTYRIITEDGRMQYVEKKTVDNWRNDNRFRNLDIKGVIREIENQL